MSLRRYNDDDKRKNIFDPWNIVFNILHQMIWLCVLSIALCRSDTQNPAPGCQLSSVNDYIFEYEYSQEGDIIIGGIFTVHGWMTADITDKSKRHLICLGPHRREYRHVRAFIFAINQINKNPDILPNITLGYHLYDPCGSENKVVENVLQILSGHNMMIPNYRCMKHGKVVGFIGDIHSSTTIQMAQLLNVYGYTQISYGARDPVLSDRRIYPHFLRTIHSDHLQHLAIVKLLKLFQWNWVGIISSKDDDGDRELQQLNRQLTAHGICIEFSLKVSTDNSFKYEINKHIIERSTSEVIIICGTNSIHLSFFIRKIAKHTVNKTFILPASWSQEKGVTLPYKLAVRINCTLVFSLPLCKFPEMDTFLDMLFLPNNTSDPIWEDILITEFLCKCKNKLKNSLLTFMTQTSIQNCTTVNVKDLSDFFEDAIPFRVYRAVITMAQALHDMYLDLSNDGKRNYLNINKYKLHRYIRNVNYQDTAGEEIFYDRYGEIASQLHIMNWIIYDLGNISEVIRTYVGTVDGFGDDEKQLYIIPGEIHWRHGRMPRGQCSEKCHNGFSKAPSGGHHACCFNCVPCTDGQISNKSANEYCVKCPDNEWPNDARNQCIPKVQDFLSYDMDTITSVFSFASLLFSIVIVFIIGLFFYFRNNQIVRANNQNLSFILLVSLKLSLLCVFLFLGRPVNITCMLRQICFGIIFTIAVSSVLAKTIMVCIAFKATRPGSYWRKWMGVKLPNSLVLTCSSVQVGNGIIWLTVSPPFQEFNMDTTPGIIIIQCNEGSVLAFYLMLGYMGLLAAVSFLLAFMVRTLPDIFNEAKYITFSMLVFCSVWVCAIPAYLSSQGKNMVIVEVFAILASCIGILGCIFFPKCYNILMRRDMKKKNIYFGTTKTIH